MKSANSQKKKAAVVQIQPAWCPICLSTLSVSKEAGLAVFKCPRHGKMRIVLEQDPASEPTLSEISVRYLEAAQNA